MGFNDMWTEKYKARERDWDRTTYDGSEREWQSERHEERQSARERAIEVAEKEQVKEK